MILDGENNWVGGGDKSTFLDDNQHILEADLGGEGVSVVDYRIAIVTIPTIQFNTSTPREQNLLNHEH